MTNTHLANVTTIVVHHRRHSSIGGVVSGLTSAGLPADQLLVVDNSEQPELLTSLIDAVAPASVITVPNRGYGAAVNAGIRAMKKRGVASEYILIATHEVAIDDQSLRSMARALGNDPTLAAVGPVLRTPAGLIWSGGGRLSRFLRLPTHRASGEDLDEPICYCDWLDGACVLYRASALPLDPFDESFFHYMEEVDLHLRLSLAGHRLGVVARATAIQDSDGTPPFLFARNLRHLNRRHLSVARRSAANPAAITRRAVGYARRGEWSAIRELWRGAIARLPEPTPRIICINPLQEALHHYAREVRSTLELSEHSVDVISVQEPSASGQSRFSWLHEYWRLLHRARRLTRSRLSSSVSVWPVVGLLDAVLLRATVGRSALVVHDPVPLVHAVGYGRLARFLARRCLSAVTLVVHSQRARADLASSLRVAEREVVLTPHPILAQQDSRRTRPDPPRIAVLGQFKPDRDVELLVQLSGELSADWVLQVSGRGWPAVAGWDVDSRFLTEAEFDAVIRLSSVIVVPYRRFYQSGVAVRALELGTPVVGPRESMLRELLGESSTWLADTGNLRSWVAAIESATHADPSVATIAHREAVIQASDGWQALFRRSR